MRKLAKCSLRNINSDFAKDWLASYGYTDEVQFWEAVSTLSSPTTQSMSTNMESALAKWGYTKTNLGDNFREWFNDISFNSNGYVSDSGKNFFPNMKSLIFLKRYDIKQENLRANFSIGTPSCTFTSSRGASNPATYCVGSTGIVTTTTTSNAGRITSGYWDSTGFVSFPSFIVEGTIANLVPKSALFNDATWAATSVTVVDAQTASPDGNTAGASVTASGANGTLLLASAVTAQTFSVWLQRKTGTGNIQISADGTNFTTVTLPSSGWGRFEISAASASQVAGIKIVTSGDAVYIWGAQFENIEFATSYIPTTGSALTRNADLPKYPTSGNRSKTPEAFFCRFKPYWSSATTFGLSYRVTSVDTVDRLILAANATDSLQFQFPTSGSTMNTTTAWSAYDNLVASFSCQSSGNPNSQIYLNGSQEATSNTDYTGPNWGSFFYVGNSAAADRPFYALVKSVAVFSTFLDATGHSNVTNLLNSV